MSKRMFPMTDAELFCNEPHPKVDAKGNPVARCRRQPHNNDPHSAYTFSVLKPETWT